MAEIEMPTKDVSSIESPNSGPSGQKAPKMERIVHEKKPTLSDRFKESFAGNIQEVAEDFIFDEIIPGVFNGVLDFMKAWFFGGRRDISYNRYSRILDDEYDVPSYRRGRKSARERIRNESIRIRRNTVNYREIVISPDRGYSMSDAKEEALMVVKAIRNRITKYGYATVADLLEACGYDSSWIDTDRGWTDEDDIGLRVVQHGYLIDVVEATDLR